MQAHFHTISYFVLRLLPPHPNHPVLALHSLCAPRQSILFLFHALRLIETLFAERLIDLTRFPSIACTVVYLNPLERRGKLSAWVVPDFFSPSNNILVLLSHSILVLYCQNLSLVYNSPAWCVESGPRNFEDSLKISWVNRSRFGKRGIV